MSVIRIAIGVAAALLAPVLAAGSATPQAFGVSADMPAAEAGVTAEVRDVLVLEPPEPNRLFESYVGRSGDGGAICEISGAMPERRRDRHGLAVQGDYAAIRALLSDKYGPGERTEVLRTGSPWVEERDWILGLLLGEREHRTDWDSALPVGLRRISLTVLGTGVARSRVTLTYEFDVGSACGQLDAVDQTGL